jgi:hypothetical protein
MGNYEPSWATSTAIENIMITQFEPDIIDYFKDELWAWKTFGADNEGVLSGKGRITTKYAKNESYKTLTAYNDALPSSGQPEWLGFEYETKRAVSAMKVYYDLVEAAKDDKASLADYLATQWEDTKETLLFHVNRQIYGDGSGKLCKCTAAADTASGTTRKQTVDTVKFLRIGMNLDIHNGGGIRSVVVTAIDEDTNTFYFTADNLPITAANDVITLDGALNREAEGFMSLIGSKTNTVFGINRTAVGNEWFKPLVYDKNNTALTYNDYKKATDNMKARKGKFTHLVTTPEVRRAYAAIFLPDMRWNNPGGALPTGYDKVTVDGQEFNVDHYCPDGVLLGVDKNTFKIKHSNPPNWMKLKDSSILERSTDGTASYDAFMTYRFQFVCRDPRRNFAILNIDTSSVA